MELIESVIELAVSLTASIVRFATDLRFARRAGFRGTSLAVEDDEDELADLPPPRDLRLLRPEDFEPPFLAEDFLEAFLEDFLPPAFFAPPLRADDFFAPPLRADDFFAPPLRADDFFAPPLRADDFFAPPFLDEALRAAGRFAEDFFAPPFFDEDFLDVAI